MMRFTIWSTAGLLLLGVAGNSVWCQEEKPSGAPQTRVDRFGDALPAGVLARMGSVRLACDDAIWSAVFSPDAKSLSVLTSASQKQLWYFDVATGKTIHRLTLPQGPRRYALTPDQRFLAVLTFYQKRADASEVGAQNFAEIHVLEASTGKLIWKTDAKHEFNAMAMSADGKLLAGARETYPGDVNDVFLWDTATGKQLALLKGHPTPVTTLAFSADGKNLLTASADYKQSVNDSKVIKGSVRVWELPAGKLVKQFTAGGGRHAFAATGRTMAFQGMDEKKVHLWDLDTDREIAALPVPGVDVLFAPDGSSLVTGSGTDTLRQWDTATGRELRRFQGLLGNGTRPLAFSADGKLLATCSDAWSHDTAIRLWDVARGIEVHPFGGHHLDIQCLAFAADGRKLISGSDDQTARIWETASGKELMVHDKHAAPVSAVAFSADGRTVASGDRANVTHIWDATTGKLLHRLQSALEAPKGSYPAIEILSFSPDGKMLWIGSRVVSVKGRQVSAERGELALYETATGKRIRAFTHENSSPRAVSPNGALAVWTVRAKEDEGLSRWLQEIVVRRLDTGRELFRIAPDSFRTKETISQVIFSPDSRLIAFNSSWLAVSFHRSAVLPCYRLVEVASGMDLVNESNSDFPWTAFMPDGRVLAGAHRIELPIAPIGGMIREQGPAIRVVDVVTKQVMGELPGYPSTNNAWAIGPGGRFFASANPNHTILVWDLTQQGLKRPASRKDATRQELENLWATLSSEDAKKAFASAVELTAVPRQSVPFLREQLKPIAGPSPQTIASLIKGLNNDDFAVREKAKVALGQMEELAEPALRQALEEETSLEVRRRVEYLLDKLDTAQRSPRRVRAARAVAVLERTDTSEARNHLKMLAAGAPGAWLTREARSSLERLDHSAADIAK